MALVTSFFPISKDQSIRSEVECGYTVSNVDGRRVLRLETYGSSDRRIPGKTSQNLRLDEKTARELVTIIRKAFPAIQ